MMRCHGRHGEGEASTRTAGICLGDMTTEDGMRLQLDEIPPPFFAFGVTVPVPRGLQASECSDMNVDGYDCHGNW